MAGGGGEGAGCGDGDLRREGNTLGNQEALRVGEEKLQEKVRVGYAVFPARPPASRRKPQARRRRSAVGRSRARTPRAGSRRPRSRPRPPGSASYFRSTHPTRSGGARPRGARAAPRSGSAGVRPTTGARPGSDSGPRASALTSPALPPARLLTAAAPTFSSSDNCSSRSAIFLLATDRGAGGSSGHLTSPFPSGLPRRAPPPREGPRRPGRRARAPELRLPGAEPLRTRLGAPPPQPRPPRTRPRSSASLPLSAGLSAAVRVRSASKVGLLWLSSVILLCLVPSLVNDDHMDPVGDEYILSP